MTELESGLLTWSEGLADWQRDVLRRLALGETLTSAELRGYADAAIAAELAKEAAWYQRPDAGEGADFAPLDTMHLRATVAGADPVTIEKILHVEGANNLAPGTALEFVPAGLTIVAGLNGTGKSGYTRILKQLAVSRGAERVLANAFHPDVAPKAVVTYAVGGLTGQEHTWEDGAARTETPLQRVRVFDSRAAAVQLSGSTDVAYVPPALQVIADYSQTLQGIASIISQDLNQVELQKREWPELSRDDGLAIFDHLGEAESLDALHATVVLTEDEVVELDGIPAQLGALAASDPAALAVQARGRATQLTTLAGKAEVIAAKITPEAIEASIGLRDGLDSAQAAAEEAAKLVQADGASESVGGDAWKEMWNAAKAYVEADGSHIFPALDADAVCPLCQQTLDAVAGERFRDYAAFMSSEAQAALVIARSLRIADLAQFGDLPIEDLADAGTLELVAVYDEGLGSRLRTLHERAVALRDSLAGVGQVEPDDEDDPLHQGLADVAAALRAHAQAETDKADVLAATGDTAAAATRLKERQDALSLRQDIAAKKVEIGAQHDRVIREQRLRAALRACDTSSASRKSTQLAQDYVAKVCDRFAVEAQALGLDRVPVELVFDGTSRGVSKIKVALKNAPSDISVASVLSEGEQRVAAIAGFFADLAESGDTSTLVFDDPVSSLDDEYRAKVARRLLEEAESRQVLVFSHDFTFIQYLYEVKDDLDLEKAAAGLPTVLDINYLHINRGPSGAGLVTTDQQWRHVPLREQIGRLKSRIQAVRPLHSSGDMVAYEKEARDIAGAIRETWEMFVEQVLLNRVVSRHERGVHTQRLAAVVDLDAQDIARVDLGMRLESRFMTGHAAPTTDSSAPQGPDWLAAELDAIDTFRGEVHRRRS